MDPKKQIQKLIDDLKTKQFREGEAKGLVQTIGGEIQNQLKPLFEGFAKDTTQGIKTAIESGFKNVRVEVPKSEAPTINVSVPDVIVPEIKVPEPKVTVNVEKQDTPIVNLTEREINFPKEMSLKREDKPFPVMMVDQVGKPMQFPISSGGGGGKADFFTIKDIQNSTGGSIIDADGFVKVTGAFSVSSSNSSTQAIDSSGNPYSQANPFPVVFGSSGTTASNIVDSSGVAYSGSNPIPVTFTGSSSTSVSLVNADGTYYNSANPVPVSFVNSQLVSQVSGASWSVYAQDALTTLTATTLVNGDNRLRVSVETGGSGLTDAELRASHLDVQQLSGTVDSVVVNSGTLTAVTDITNPIQVRQVSGTADSTSVGSAYTMADGASPNGFLFGIGSQGTVSNVPFGFNGSTYDRLRNSTGEGGGLRTQQATDSVSSVYITGTSASLPVSQVSGANWSVYAQDALTTLTATSLVNGDNRIRVSVETGGSGLTDSELRATAVPVSQVSGAIDSVSVVNPLPAGTNLIGEVYGVGSAGVKVQQFTITEGYALKTAIVDGSGTQITSFGGGTQYAEGASASTYTGTALIFAEASSDVAKVVSSVDPLPMTMSTALDYTIDSISTHQVSGANFSVSVTDIFGSTGTGFYNGDNRLRVSLETGGSGLTDAELRASHLDVQQVSGSVDSVVVNSGTLTAVTSITNAVEVRQVSGAINSVSVIDIFGTTATNLVNPDNRLKVELPSAGLTDTELRASTLDIRQVSGSNFSVSVTDIFGSTGTGFYNLDNRLRVEMPTYTQPVSGTVTASATDLDIRDLVNASDSVSAYQVSGANWSVFATNPVDNGDSATALRVTVAGNSSASVSATQVGTWNIGTVTTVTGVTNSLAVVALDRDGNPLTTGPIAQGDSATALRVVIAGNSDASVTATQSGTWNIGTVTTVTGVTNTLASNIVDSSGIAYTTTNPLPIGDAGGSLTIDGSVTVSGASDSFFAYEVMTTNKTAKSDGADIRPKTDDLGRQVMRPVQVRDLITTAFVSLTNGTETTLLASSAGVFHDLIYILGANDSDYAVRFDIRDVTGGGIVNSIVVPPSGTSGLSTPVPLPQSATGNNWTVDMPDITGTTLTVTALFTKEI